MTALMPDATISDRTSPRRRVSTGLSTPPATLPAADAVSSSPYPRAPRCSSFVDQVETVQDVEQVGHRGFARIAATVRSVHPPPDRCRFLAGSAADGPGTPASLLAPVLLAAHCRASRWANIHVTTGAMSGSGSRRCARLPHAACALFGCGPASPSMYPYGGGPPREW